MGKRDSIRTSATSAESAISVAAFGADPDNLAINILGVVWVDVTGTTTAVRNFGGGHCE